MKQYTCTKHTVISNTFLTLCIKQHNHPTLGCLSYVTWYNQSEHWIQLSHLHQYLGRVEWNHGVFSFTFVFRCFAFLGTVKADIQTSFFRCPFLIVMYCSHRHGDGHRFLSAVKNVELHQTLNLVTKKLTWCSTREYMKNANGQLSGSTSQYGAADVDLR